MRFEDEIICDDDYLMREISRAKENVEAAIKLAAPLIDALATIGCADSLKSTDTKHEEQERQKVSDYLEKAKKGRLCRFLY